MKTRPAVAVTATLMLSLSGCAWWENVTGQTSQSSAVSPQGAANFNSMISAINSEPQQTRQLAELGTVDTNKVVIANADMMAPGSSGRELNQAMHQNARSIEDLRHQVDKNPSLKRVLGKHGVPVNNVVALDVTGGGGVVVYALPPMQTGQVPTARTTSGETADQPFSQPADIQPTNPNQ